MDGHRVSRPALWRAVTRNLIRVKADFRVCGSMAAQRKRAAPVFG